MVRFAMRSSMPLWLVPSATSRHSNPPAGDGSLRYSRRAGRNRRELGGDRREPEPALQRAHCGTWPPPYRPARGRPSQLRRSSTARASPELAGSYELDREKLAGFGEGLASHGLSLASVTIVETLPADPGAGDAILDAAPDATAVFCMADRQALTLLEACRSRAIRVPEDLSIVGFDGVPETATTTPPLTTVAQDTRGKGRLAAEMALSELPPRQVILPVELVVRSSTAPPRDR